MNLFELQQSTHDRSTDLRAIDALLQTPIFVELWNQSDADQRATIEKFVRGVKRGALEDFLQWHPARQLDDMHVMRLRELARRCGISNYCSMTKQQIVHLLKLRGTRDDESGND